jgi:prevent-host-death family protein
MDVGIRQAKLKLSKLVRMAEAGGEVILTRGGRAVAKIVPVRLPANRDRAQLLRDIRALARRVGIPRDFPIRKVVAAGRR